MTNIKTTSYDTVEHFKTDMFDHVTDAILDGYDCVYRTNTHVYPMVRDQLEECNSITRSIYLDPKSDKHSLAYITAWAKNMLKVVMKLEAAEFDEDRTDEDIEAIATDRYTTLTQQYSELLPVVNGTDVEAVKVVQSVTIGVLMGMASTELCASGDINVIYFNIAKAISVVFDKIISESNNA